MLFAYNYRVHVSTQKSNHQVTQLKYLYYKW
jgi:hypothetical protein